MTIYPTNKGRRVAFKNVDAKVASGAWHTLRVDFAGNIFVVTFDNKKVIEATDDRFAAASKVGVWTKADSVKLFDDFRYGRLDATDAEIEEAARMVNADEFIRTLEKSYDSEVGEGGNRLSTGQKQLISFARAILVDPQIFVMDEATWSIDTETVQLIQAALKCVFAARLSFVIAHQLSTIRAADLIFVINHRAASKNAAISVFEGIVSPIGVARNQPQFVIDESRCTFSSVLRPNENLGILRPR